MINASVKNALKRTFVYELIKFRRDQKALRAWEQQGKPDPAPHIVKERVLKEYASRFNPRVLIETGTYLGDMVHATRKTFDRIFSLEFDPTLCKSAQERFAGDKHISILQGDSGELLKELLPSINQPCLFWLDGHYSGGVTGKATLETPIRKELDHILNHPVAGHVILIDDARCFTGYNDYPTVDELRETVAA
ncbi:MAG: hypothetical protein QOD75_1790, partial [Blastocatellia bacterium]|nr:hypothetical protein [Blastocatellia bacterium]